jgi:endonuclease III
MSITIPIVVELLERAYGLPERSRSRPEPIDELVQTILSQHTSDINTARAFASLRERFPDWTTVVETDVDDVIDAIRTGGLANQKAPRIQRVLREIVACRGDFDLHFLESLTVDDAMAWLTRLPGVGPKTAACVLLFSLNQPVMPVDTHVHRVALRLGIIPAGTTAEKAHGLIGHGLTPEETYIAHILFIQHGRRTCKARAPLCRTCILQALCPSSETYLM